MMSECPICLSDLHHNIGAVIPCGHCFHRNCYQDWISSSQQQQSSVVAILQHQRTNRRNRRISLGRQTNENCSNVVSCPICKVSIQNFQHIFVSFHPPQQEGDHVNHRKNDEAKTATLTPTVLSLQETLHDSHIEQSIRRQKQQQNQKEHHYLMERIELLEIETSNQQKLVNDIIPKFQSLSLKYEHLNTLQSTLSKEREEAFDEVQKVKLQLSQQSKYVNTMKEQLNCLRLIRYNGNS